MEDNYGADDDDNDGYYDPDGSEEADGDPNFVLVERGPASTVRKTWKEEAGSSSAPQWVAVKTSTTNRKFSHQPHDVVKEVRLLSSLSHVNVRVYIVRMFVSLIRFFFFFDVRSLPSMTIRMTGRRGLCTSGCLSSRYLWTKS